MTSVSRFTGPSRTARWAGYCISAIIVVFLVFDAVIKLIPLDVVLETSRELGLPASEARTLGVIALVCALLYSIPQTSILGAILLTAYLGGAVSTHLRVGSPLFSHTLFGVYLGILVWGGLYLRDPVLRTLIPLKR